MCSLLYEEVFLSLKFQLLLVLTGILREFNAQLLSIIGKRRYCEEHPHSPPLPPILESLIEPWQCNSMYNACLQFREGDFFLRTKEVYTEQCK